MVMPRGVLNSPSAVPYVPHLARKVPVESNFWMRLLPISATKTLPEASVVTPLGYWNLPSFVPTVQACSGTSVGSGVALAVLVVNGMRVVMVNSRDSIR